MPPVDVAGLIKAKFAKASILDIMDRLPNLDSPALDFLYPEANRKLHPLPFISYKDLVPLGGNIPLVKRGSASYRVGENEVLTGIEPQAVAPSSNLDAVDINNLRMLDPEGQTTLISNRIDGLRRICRDTAQAMAIQSVTGKLNYDMRGPTGGFLKFNLDYGTPADVPAAVKFDAVGAKIGTLVEHLSKMKSKAQAQGFGRNPVFLAPSDVYAAILNLYPDNVMPPIDAEGNLVLAPTLKVRLFDYSYWDFTNNAAVGLAAKKLVLWDRGAGASLVYAAVDDIEANFQATPFWVKPVEVPDPSGYNIIGQSKPLPVPNVKGIVTSTVLT